MRWSIVLHELCVCVLVLILSACSPENASTPTSTAAASAFVRVEGNKFYLRGQPYRFVGANLWYAAYLGSDAVDIGDRERLQKELDLLQRYGITNLRILGASERSPLENSITPAISFKGQVERDDILRGLDYTLAEMARRDMKAVIYLNNFWEWSGGMATYLSWVNGGLYIDMSDPNHPWPAFALFAAMFYQSPEAIALNNTYIKQLLQRKNTVTGMLYKDDPTIMAWQLANEPRPGDGHSSRNSLAAYVNWIESTAKLIKKHAPNQLVSVGSEGVMGCLDMKECYIAAHTGIGIDYATFHLWPKNWGWYDVADPENTFPRVLARAGRYIDDHIQMANQLNMPLVLEEFGLDRDLGKLTPGSDVKYRNQFLRFIFARINDSAHGGGPFVGSNIWSWGGYGKALHDDAQWRAGDKSFVGDPPQEPQGLNSVYASDIATLDILKSHYDAITAGLNAPL